MAKNITIKGLRESLEANVAGRVEYENAKDVENSHAAAKVQKYAAGVNHDAVLKFAAECGLESFDFINEAKRTNARFNIYAIEKVAKALRHGVAAGRMDKHTTAIMRNLLNLRAKLEAGSFKYGRSVVKSTVSKHFRDGNAESYVSELDERNAVSHSTAATQASSSLRALAVLGVCGYDDEQRTISGINWDHPLFEKVKGGEEAAV